MSVPPCSRDGDQYVGSRWNELSVLYLIFLLTPLAGLLFAYLTYGKLWATGESPREQMGPPLLLPLLLRAVVGAGSCWCCLLANCLPNWLTGEYF